MTQREDREGVQPLATPSPIPLTIRGLRIWDGVGARYRADADAIRIEGERIAAVGEGAMLGRGARVVDGAGLTALPGLIDAHVHLCLDPEVRQPHEQLTGAALRAPMAARARTMLRAGITTARDLGGGQWVELAIRDAIAAGEIEGPRLLCAGQPVTSPGGHCHFWGGEALRVEDALVVIRRQIAHRVDLIKVMATGGNLTPGSDPVTAQFGAEELAAMTAEARRHGRRVAAHCHGTDGIRNACQAGVATIEHCSWVGAGGWGADYDAQTAGAIARAGIRVSPTVNAGWTRHVGRGGSEGFETRVRRNFQRMRSAGVHLIASTDAGIPGVRHHDLPLALPVFQHFTGLGNLEILRSATAESAEALGVGELTGRIAAGLSADLLLVAGDPLNDLAAIGEPVEILARGRPALGALAPV